MPYTCLFLYSDNDDVERNDKVHEAALCAASLGQCVMMDFVTGVKALVDARSWKIFVAVDRESRVKQPNSLNVIRRFSHQPTKGIE